MVLSQEDVLQILRIMDESNYGQLHLEVGELKIGVNKNGSPGLSQGEQTLPVPVPADVPKNEGKEVESVLLAGKAEPIEEITDEIRQLAEKMVDIMIETKGVGLAGPQAGVSLRIFVASPSAIAM